TVADAMREYSPTIPWVETLSLPKLLYEMDVHNFSLRSRRQNKAWGGAQPQPQEYGVSTHQAREAGDSASSQILFVVFDTVRFQKFYELVSERFFLMMLFLPRNIILHFLNVRLTDRERSVTALPGKILQIRKHISHPSARV